MEKKEKKEIFGSFFLNDSEFAISVQYVQEVVVPPMVYAQLPLSPVYLKGLFNLRGTVIPVVDLKSIFKLAETQSTEDQRIAIVEIGQYRLGLLFDKTCEIFRSHDDEKNDFEDVTEEKLICGVFKKNNGQRIVQILNIPAILKLQNIPQQAELDARQNQESRTRKRGLQKKCISLHIGPSRCALGIQDIQEIRRVEKIQNSVLAIDYCLGIIDIRGSTVPVIDCAGFFGYPTENLNRQKDDQRIVVLKIDGVYFGLLVDAVDSIVSYFPDELVNFPVINNPRSEMFVGCILASDKAEILLLNPHKILHNDEIKALTHGHSQLYKASESEKNTKKVRAGAKKTYISFSIKDTYAVGIEDIREIIDMPESLMHPPGLPAHFKGILNLRGELVTVIDARAMYSIPARADDGKGKVLIFKKGSDLFGLVVDSVEGIQSFHENDRTKLPETMFVNTSFGLNSDIQEAVSISNGTTRVNLLILNMKSIADRVQNRAA